jgi:hypothetical protein
MSSARFRSGELADPIGVTKKQTFLEDIVNCREE